ncbi:right-handed parallel beta-helix repeat-containing protein [Salinispora arenicola]|uniref:right-handed parallel beta-helix repeat-containing protein n=1 Tax=Salinispora arenicola TaxID=168697 RepID=UPI00207A3C9D|nr:right-handed parallel beta-helix repeat-containing protein [Salinispora arenicola]MCN0155172.1 right-handed parallel beta-helix repeat-containing protein [Salinispora arenicola]
MNHPLHDHEPDPPGGRRARSRWWAVGLAGMTGLALTTVGVTAGPAADAVARTPTTAGDRPSADDDRSQHDDGNHDDKDQNRGDKNKGKKEKKPKGVPVPCKTDALIAAITHANARGGAVLDLATKCTYTLTTNIDGAGLPAIATPITLNGGEHTTITRAAAAPLFRIITINIGGDLTLNHLAINGGQTDSNGGGILVNTGAKLTINRSAITRNIASGNGGGIATSGTTTVQHSVVSHNSAELNGGGIYNTGQLTVSKSHVDANTANDFGGIGSLTGSSIQIERSTLTGNSARQSSGAIVVGFGAIGKITDTRITKNTAGEAGAVSVAGQLTLKRVTLADNTATTLTAGGLIIGPVGTAVVEDSHIKNNNAGTDGGGVFNQGVLTLRRTKVTGNQAGDQGGGVFNPTTGTVRLFSTKVAKNVAVADGGGIFNQAGGTVNLNIASGTFVVKNRPDNCAGDVPGCAG